VISAKRKPFRFILIPSALAGLAFAALVLASSPANAQTRWDASLQVGASGRIFSGNPNVAGLPGSIGPVVGLEGDVALVPLLRLGAYADFEYADTGEPAAPTAVSFGGRVKVMLPGYRGGVHWWLFTGFGGVVLDAPGYSQSVVVPVTEASLSTVSATVPSATGYFMEVPVGIGMGWRLRKPWELVAELQGRFGFDMGGSYFTDDGTGNGLSRPATAPASPQISIPTGTDVLAILLTVGIGLDE
jgi:hypothetical protein